MVSRFWCGVSVEGKKKSDEEAKKRQRIGLREKRVFFSNSPKR
jgi:hypothetical protein